MFEKYMGTFLYGMMTTEPMQFILVCICMGLLFQMFVSFLVLVNRKEILKDEYGFNDKQIRGFFWKSVVFFPLTWVLLIGQGISGLWRRIRNR